ncbi:MAG: AAA family ATPase [Myxococcota bacterium]|nr:AAA family ATPase [Myxococcota bacterium]
MEAQTLSRAQALGQSLIDGLNARLLGQEQLVHMVAVACLARGHVLLEGLPGLGKTELVKGVAGFLGLDFRRVQFTPDLLPGDVTGGPVLEEKDGARRFVFHPGPIFGNVVLADEINRASPRTQSAMLEAMQERRVTVLGETHPLPDPFWVLATQNPIELEGTFPLPEAQLDRFLFKLDVRRVGADTLTTLLTERRRGRPPEPVAVSDKAGLDALFDAVDQVFLPKAVAAYIARLVNATHPEEPSAPEQVKRYARYGASPRAAIAIAESARAHALLAGKPNAGFDDVRAVAPHALGHRVVVDYKARLDGISGRDLAEFVLEQVDELGSALPAELS